MISFTAKQVLIRLCEKVQSEQAKKFYVGVRAFYSGSLAYIVKKFCGMMNFSNMHTLWIARKGNSMHFMQLSISLQDFHNMYHLNKLTKSMTSFACIKVCQMSLLN